MKTVPIEKDFSTTDTNFNYFILIGFYSSKECEVGGKGVRKKKKKYGWIELMLATRKALHYTSDSL